MTNSLALIDEVADEVYRLGTRHINWYVVVDGGAVTVVDTGLPRYWSQLEHLLAALGRSLRDIEAVLLTHADPDHLGNAQRIATEAGASIYIHRADVSAVTRQERIAAPRLPMRRPPVASFMFHAIRNGLLRWQTVESPMPVGDQQPLEVPGEPTVVHTPGHTPGSVCFVFSNRDAVFVGDALLNSHPVSGQPGPILSPVEISADHNTATQSLAILKELTQQIVLYGHGDLTGDGIATAVQQAQLTR